MSPLISNGIINRLPAVCFCIKCKNWRIVSETVEPGAKPHFEKDAKFIFLLCTNSVKLWRLGKLSFSSLFKK